LDKCFEVRSLAITFVFLLSVFRGDALAGEINIQQSTCVGPADRPVVSIYMHGWFHDKGNGAYEALQQRNIALLEKLAFERRVRIAIPVAKMSNTKHGSLHSWKGYDLPQVERMASEACGGARLAQPRSLICFSDGAYACQRFARSSKRCAVYDEYFKVLVIGAHKAEHTSLANGQQAPSPKGLCGSKMIEIHREPPNHQIYRMDLTDIDSALRLQDAPSSDEAPESNGGRPPRVSAADTPQRSRGA